MKHIEIYPSSISQPNQNEASGLQGKCFKEVRRGGKVYDVNCRYQKDPKYHHKWSNTTNLKSKGKAAQCGRPSRYHCSHATYYGIKGYRNTCPIAGVSGTYTMPATLRVGFDLKKNGLVSGIKVHKVIVHLEHRCTGVDVGNGAETIAWGPNFYGYDKYPTRKALKFKFVDKNGNKLSSTVSQNSKKEDFPNPPLSNNYSGVSAEFTDVSFSDLKNGYLDIIYGNNLSTNPGNIYIKNVKIEVHYEDSTPYIEGKASRKNIYYSEDLSCDNTIKFTIEAGYKNGSTKISPNKAPKKLQDDIRYTLPKGLAKKDLIINPLNDGKTVEYTLSDARGELGEHKIKFYLKDNSKKSISFKYTVNKGSLPEIIIPSVIKKNTNPNGVIGIIAQNGCSSEIQVYLSNNTNLFEKFTGTDIIKGESNLISQAAADRFYKKLALLDCGYYTLFIKRRSDDTEMIQKRIKIEAYNHKFEFYDGNTKINRFEASQGSTETSISVKYATEDTFQIAPIFKIKNPTKNSADIILNTSITDTVTIPIGTSKVGSFKLKVVETQSCPSKDILFDIEITNPHKQYFDKLFIRVEDSTSVDYDYLVAWEGDLIKQPIGVSRINIGADISDIKVCAERSKKSGITQLKTTQIRVMNNSKQDITNLYLELNVLDENKIVTTEEWVDIHGAFFNFKQNFMDFNSQLGNNVQVLNLTEDNDFVDEENVYLKINKIEAGQSIPMEIPFGSAFEKDIYLQVLLFDEPLKLYENCSTPFDEIHLHVYDSLLTEMNIEGDLDIQNKTGNCYDTTNGVTYSIRNIDTSNFSKKPECLIINDPRVIPYKIEYNNVEYTNQQFSSLPNSIRYENVDDNIIPDVIRGGLVTGYIDFPGVDRIELSGYTDKNGYVNFTFDIPKETGKSYTFDELLEIAYFDFEGDFNYNWASIGSLQIAKEYNNNELLNNSYFIKLQNYIRYKPGERMLIQFKLACERKYVTNQFVFYPDIIKSGDIDSITIWYKMCDIENEIFETTFKTNDLELIDNEISKDIYCGVDTDLHIFTDLKERIIEKKNINILKIYVKNNKRDNKNIVISMFEKISPEKYKLDSYDIETGVIQFIELGDEPQEPGSLVDRKLEWIIDSMKKNEIVEATIQFEADQIGLSEIEIKARDFLSGGV